MNGQLDKLYGSDSTTSQSSKSKALLKGILLGETEELSDEQVENFKISSLYHILAVSGMHIAYLILATMFILKILGISKQKIHLITILVIIFFMFLTKFAPSIVRAGIMGILMLTAFLVKRKSDLWINISLSSLIILTCNPYVLVSLSYQLSFLGTIGIVFGMKMLNVYRNSKPISNKKVVIEAIVVCLSAQLFVFPMILLNFNTVSIYFLLANLLVAPIIGTIIILGFIVIFISYLIYPLAHILNLVENMLLYILDITTNFISNLPKSIIYLKTPYISTVIIYYAIMLIFIGFWITQEKVIKRNVKKYLKRILKIFKIFISIYLILILIIDLNIFSSKYIKIHFIDVGQGDSTLVITETNKKILIDGGGSNDKNFDIGKNTTLPYLLDRRITSLDYVMISHFDSDHVQGLYAVLENIKVDNVIISKQKENSKNFEMFLEIARDKNINIIFVKAGDKIYFDKSSYANILWPMDEITVSENPLNNNSIVFNLVYKKFSMLFTGDIEEVAEKAILKTYSSNINVLKADVLKVAHHGSKSSSSIKFLEAVKPKIALIGVGKTNMFGHPYGEVLERLEKLRIQIFRTDEDGEISIRSNGQERYNLEKFVNNNIKDL